MTSIPCPGCGAGDGGTEIARAPDRLWLHPGIFRLVRCPDCGFVYMNPRPTDEELSSHYPENYYGPPGEDFSPAFRWRLSEIERRAPGAITRQVPRERKYSLLAAPGRPAPGPGRGKLLDVGCHTGVFLLLASGRGWDVAGIDNSPAAISAAEKVLAGKVRLGALLEARYPSGAFDVATLFEVLEHLPEPIAHLKEIHRLLKPGGRLCISVPNYASLERRLFGAAWAGLDLPRHLQQFTPRTLRRSLEQAGFEMESIRSVNASHVQSNKSAANYCQESIRFFLRDRGLYPPPPQPPASAPGSPISPSSLPGKHGAMPRRPPRARSCSARAAPGAIPAEKEVHPLRRYLPPIWRQVTRRAPCWKRLLHAVEWIGFSPIWATARVLDSDNTLLAWARKH